MIKKGDNVIIITGKSKGVTGKVAKVIPLTGRLIVEGAQKVSRKMRGKKRGEKGSVVEKEASLHMSNVMLVEGKTRVRSSMKVSGDKKVRISKKSGKEI